MRLLLLLAITATPLRQIPQRGQDIKIRKPDYVCNVGYYDENLRCALRLNLIV